MERQKPNRRSAQAKQRAKRRRRNRFIFRIICIMLICAAVILAPTVFFRVSNIEVEGDTRYAQKDLIAASGVHIGDNMFFMDSEHIANLLYKEYPYLEHVALHRRLPSTLQIKVSDRTPVLSVATGDGYLLMDLNGKILEKVKMQAAGTVIVTGINTAGLKVGSTVGKKQEKLTTVLNLMDLMIQYKVNEKVDSINMQKAYDVRMEYDGEYEVLLGDLNELEHKIQFLQAILREPSLPGNSVIDLTDDKEARYRPKEIEKENTSGAR